MEHHGTSWNHSFNHSLKILKGLKGSWESRMASHMVASMVATTSTGMKLLWPATGRRGRVRISAMVKESTLQILTGSGTWNRSEIWKRLEIHHDHTWSTWEMQTETGRAVFGALQAQSDLCFLLIPEPAPRSNTRICGPQVCDFLRNLRDVYRFCRACFAIGQNSLSALLPHSIQFPFGRHAYCGNAPISIKTE